LTTKVRDKGITNNFFRPVAVIRYPDKKKLALPEQVLPTDFIVLSIPQFDLVILIILTG
jgi:hypothetical protein